MADEFPLLPFRSTLYDPGELFAGFDLDDPVSYSTTPDFAAYRSTRLEVDNDIRMLRALHDQCITEARDRFIAGRPVVAIMGGHDMSRNDHAYAEVVELAAALTDARMLVASGGGPGAMEASHLGALLGRRPGEERARAIARLADGPTARFPDQARRLVDASGAVDRSVLGVLHAWQRRAFELWSELTARPARPVEAGRATVDPPGALGESIAIPTWFYGHEPPTPFATGIAKYFANALREDGLLAVADAGVIYAPGRAGTLQEVFQDAAQNYYRVWHGRFSPMVFLDTDGHWTRRFPVLPVLDALFDPVDRKRYVHVTPDPHEAVAFVVAGLDEGAPSR